MHKVVDLKVLYFGTPVVLIGSRNPDGSPTIAPMSSAWWLGQHCLLGMGNSAQTTANLLRERQCVLNLASASMVDAVDRLALTTAAPVVPAHKAAMGYRYAPDKFTAAGLTRQDAELVGAPRVAQCPIQLECEVDAAYPFGGPESFATAFQVRVVRAHVDDDLLVPGTAYVDPLRWDPLIMKFCEFFGGGVNVHPSRLSESWQLPHHLASNPAGRFGRAGADTGRPRADRVRARGSAAARTG